MPRILFATGNPNKVSEIRALVPDELEVLSLSDIGWKDPIPEPHDTLEANAIEKARTLADALEVDCFAEDTGLEVKSIGGRPGVYSARYAGEDADPSRNMEKLLGELEGIEDRTARFRTIIAMVLDRATYCFEGTVEGRISFERKGEGGFGYDPIFIPDGYDKSFAELGSEIKTQISHRAVATRKATEFLNTYIKRKSRG